jgi:hypothetical protein
MTYLYGDSTRFPYDWNFIETIRHAVECCVALMGAQHVIGSTLSRLSTADRRRQADTTRLESITQAVERALAAEMSTTSEAVLRSVSRILDNARGVIREELGALEMQADRDGSSARAVIDEARGNAYRALEAFLLRHDMPETEVGLRLAAHEAGYAAEGLVATPFGVDAVFDLGIPAAHEWGRPRRVADLSAGTEVHVPREAGWLSKRLEVQAVKLDRHYVSRVSIVPDRSILWLRKLPQGGPGYKVDVDSSREAPRISITGILENGNEAGDEPLPMSGEDNVHVFRLWQRVLDSTSDLPMRRHAMRSATLDDTPIARLDEPRILAERLIKALAPTVVEIARRSGAPGELVLRRDIRQGRRDEIFITKAELLEKVMTLPPGLRVVFDPLALAQSPRSPRAPAPSVPAYEELHPDESGSIPPRPR